MPSTRKLEPARPSKLAAEVGAILTAARGERSRRQLAADIGVSATTLRELETGTANPTVAYLEAVARAYGVDVEVRAR